MTVSTIDERTALVVIDLQNSVVAQPTAPIGAAEVITRTRELADAFRAHQLPVVLVRVTSSGEDWMPGRTEWPRPGGAPAEGWDQIVPELAGHTEDIIVTKRNMGAFYGTDLDLQLRRRGITQVVLTGIATSFGVDSTARAAYEHGYNVTLATDAMSDRTPEGHHSAITYIFPRLGESATTREILALLEKTHS